MGRIVIKDFRLATGVKIGQGAGMPHPNPLIVSTDFDGTLVEHQVPGYSRGRFAPGFVDWLKAARREREVIWVINTGRDWLSLQMDLEALDVKEWPDWVVLIERHVYQIDGRSHRPLQEYNVECDRQHASLFQRAAGLLEHIRRELSGWAGLDLIIDTGSPLGLIAASDAQADEVSEWLEEVLVDEPDLVPVRNSIYFRFAHRGFHKGSGLQAIARHLGLEASHCFAAGDQFNDLPMLKPEVARYLCCPGNALLEVREQVRAGGGYVARGIAGEGTVEGLRHFFGP